MALRKIKVTYRRRKDETYVEIWVGDDDNCSIADGKFKLLELSEAEAAVLVEKLKAELYR